MRIRLFWFTASLMLMFLLPPLIASASDDVPASAGWSEAAP